MPRLLQRVAPFALLVVCGAALIVTGCAGPETDERVAASRCDRLLPGTTYTADLDNDSVLESILIDDSRVTISDGDVVYHSREKWKVVDSSLGDVDGDGYLEVVTLVDDEEGRHIGLFAFFGGEYRERVVTSELSDTPFALRVCDSGSLGDYDGPMPSDLRGDLIVLLDDSDSTAAGPSTLLRWNGFGFTRISPGEDVTEP